MIIKNLDIILGRKVFDIIHKNDIMTLLFVKILVKGGSFMKSNIRNAPELEWLKVESVNGTPEGSDTVNKEYKRTLCSIELLNFVLKEG